MRTAIRRGLAALVALVAALTLAATPASAATAIGTWWSGAWTCTYAGGKAIKIQVQYQNYKVGTTPYVKTTAVNAISVGRGAIRGIQIWQNSPSGSAQAFASSTGSATQLTPTVSMPGVVNTAHSTWDSVTVTTSDLGPACNVGIAIGQ